MNLGAFPEHDVERSSTETSGLNGESFGGPFLAASLDLTSNDLLARPNPDAIVLFFFAPVLFVFAESRSEGAVDQNLPMHMSNDKQCKHVG